MNIFEVRFLDQNGDQAAINFRTLVYTTESFAYNIRRVEPSKCKILEDVKLFKLYFYN